MPFFPDQVFSAVAYPSQAWIRADPRPAAGITRLHLSLQLPTDIEITVHGQGIRDFEFTQI